MRAMSRAKPETAAGRRKLSDAHRAKLSAVNKAKYDALTPEQKAAQLARLGRTPRSPAGGPKPPKDPTTRQDPPSPPGGRVNPLAMTPLELVRHLRQRGSAG